MSLPKLCGIPATLAYLALFCSGCEQDGIVSPTQSVIAEDDAQDFGLEGKWDALLGEAHDYKRSHSWMRITKLKGGGYSIEKDPHRRLKGTLRATTLSDENSFAIVEISFEQHNSESLRMLAITWRNNDFLSVWPISDENLAACMEELGYKLTVDPTFCFSRVQATPEELLHCIRKNPKTLAGKRKLYKLAPEPESDH